MSCVSAEDKAISSNSSYTSLSLFFCSSILVPGEDRKGTYCVSFYFSMHGLHMGALQLLVETQERYNLKWQMEGDLGELWLYQEYTVQLNIGDRVR